MTESGTAALLAQVAEVRRGLSALQAQEAQLLAALRPAAAAEADPALDAASALRSLHARVAFALRVHPHTAAVALSRAEALVGLGPLHADLRAGQVGFGHVLAVLGEVRDADPDVAVAAYTAVRSRQRSEAVAPSALAAKVRAELLRRTPAEPLADRAAEAALADRDVHVRDVGLGMAELRAVLPLDAAAACLGALRDDLAALPAADPRTVGQQLADCLVARLTGSAGCGRSGAPLVQVLVPVEVVAGHSDAPAVLVGHGPVPASAARRVSAMPGAVLQRVLVDRAGVPLAVDPRTAAPHRLRVPGGSAAGSPATGRGPRRRGQSWTAPPHVGGVRGRTASTHPAGPPPHAQTWSAPSLAAQLDAWQATAAEALAALGPPDRVHPGYRPPAWLDALVRARDVTCRFPGCRRAAARCDLDHVVPRAAGGPTRAGNLVALCRSHHRLKHTPGWIVTRGDDGSVTWTTPDGTRAASAPDHLPVAGLGRPAAPGRSVALPAAAGTDSGSARDVDDEVRALQARAAQHARTEGTTRVGGSRPQGPSWPEPIGDLPRALWTRDEHDLVAWLLQDESAPEPERPLRLAGDEDWPDDPDQTEPVELEDSPLVAAWTTAA